MTHSEAESFDAASKEEEGERTVAAAAAASETADDRREFLRSLVREKKCWDGKKGKFCNLLDVYADPRVLHHAYLEVVGKQGPSSTATIDIQIQEPLIPQVSEALRKGSWPRPKQDTSKASKPLPRNLSLYEKVAAVSIQITIQTILDVQSETNQLFELTSTTSTPQPASYFSKASLGGTPNGHHRALYRVLSWGACPWYLRADPGGDSNSMYDPKRALSILKDSIEDPILETTLHQFIGRTTGGGGNTRNDPLSILLTNVYWNELDRFIRQEKSNLHAQTELEDPTLTKSDRRNIHYVRYHNEYLIGVKGSKSFAKEVQRGIEHFLESHHIESNHGMYNSEHNAVRFLGFDIKTRTETKPKIRQSHEIQQFTKIRHRLNVKKEVEEARYDKFITELYEREKRRTLKSILLKSSRAERETIIRNFAKTDAKKELKDRGVGTQEETPPIVDVKSTELAKKWLEDEYLQLKTSWIEDTSLDELGLSKVVAARENLMKAMEEARQTSHDKIGKWKTEEGKRIAQSSIRDPRDTKQQQDKGPSLRPALYAPMEELKVRLKAWGMISTSGKPKAVEWIFKYHDMSIIEDFKARALGLLHIYRPAGNYTDVKRLVDYHMRWSLLKTLAGKHNKPVQEIISTYGKTPTIVLAESDHGEEEPTTPLASFLTPNEINHRKRGFRDLMLVDPMKHFESLDRPIAKVPIPKRAVKPGGNSWVCLDRPTA